MGNATSTSGVSPVVGSQGREPGGRAPTGGGNAVSGGTGGSGGRPRDAGAPSLFDRYKPEQGMRVRGVSLAAALLLAFGFAAFLNDQLETLIDPAKKWTVAVARGIPLLVGLVVGAAGWWFTFRNRGSSDFLIATEGEMRKVNWSSRREVIGSTQVVIAFTIIFGILMGAVDLVFFKIFQWIGVLKEGVTGLGDPGG
jgi:preprotein translocase SecE subunit